MIVVDTREQLPLPFGKTRKQIRQKLDVGDYTTIDLLGKFHIERKSPGDLYASIIQGHNRFRKEIMRAKAQGIKIIIMVECPEQIFIKKRWSKIAPKLRTPGNTLKKIIDTIQHKYDVKVIWCYDRDDMVFRMNRIFAEEKEKIDK